jgi:hypothetical protein
LFIQLRSNSRYYQGLIHLDGKRRQISLKTDKLTTALKLGEEWYRKELKQSDSERRAHPIERLGTNPTMGDLYASYKAELTKPKQVYLAMKWGPIGEFWRTVDVADVTTPKLKEFKKWRQRHKTRTGDPIKPHTIHKDLIVIRKILKFAVEEGHITQVPLFPSAGEIEANPRPWLTPAEWRTLLKVSAERINEAETKSARRRRQDLDDEMRWFVGSMMRISDVVATATTPGLRFRDCRVVKNARGERVLICIARGKKHPREVVTTPSVVPIFERRLKAAGGDNSNLIFPVHQRDALTELLKDERANLYMDSDGFPRNFKSLRATSISFAILAGKPKPDLTAIARNAGTSILMIDNFYAKRLSAEMHLDTLSLELPSEAREFKKMVASVRPAYEDIEDDPEYQQWLHQEKERELSEWHNT